MSTASTVLASPASDTVKPSRTTATASSRLAGVTRFSAPISSSSPHRSQFERSVFHCSYWASVTVRPDSPVWADGPQAIPAASNRIADMRKVIFVMFPSRVA